MSLELVRKFVGGRWKYVTEEEASGGGGSGGISTVKVALTDAQLKTLPTAGITLVAAPGAGKMIVVVSAAVIVDTTAASYTGFGSPVPALVLGVPFGYGGAQALVSDLDGFFSSGSEQVILLGPWTTMVDLLGQVEPVRLDLVDVENKALELFAINDVAATPTNFTGGDAANSGSVTVSYVVIDV